MNRNRHDRELLSGDEWYQVQAFRALNQAIGRCIRHRDDWGCIILLDARFAENRIIGNLSKWVRSKSQIFPSYADTDANLAKFIRSRKLVEESAAAEEAIKQAESEALVASNETVADTADASTLGTAQQVTKLKDQSSESIDIVLIEAVTAKTSAKLPGTNSQHSNFVLIENVAEDIVISENVHNFAVPYPIVVNVNNNNKNTATSSSSPSTNTTANFVSAAAPKEPSGPVVIKKSFDFHSFRYSSSPAAAAPLRNITTTSTTTPAKRMRVGSANIDDSSVMLVAATPPSPRPPPPPQYQPASSSDTNYSQEMIIQYPSTPAKINSAIVSISTPPANSRSLLPAIDLMCNMCGESIVRVPQHLLQRLPSFPPNSLSNSPPHPVYLIPAPHSLDSFLQNASSSSSLSSASSSSSLSTLNANAIWDVDLGAAYTPMECSGCVMQEKEGSPIG